MEVSEILQAYRKFVADTSNMIYNEGPLWRPMGIFITIKTPTKSSMQEMLQADKQMRAL